ncbi:heterogeneous nuclear ribonucleoprotein L-like [Petromyzon marinus]|uniref:heterogeneous nuclear ribonucleoprotein L-like n=1 Tax=Petromyzon marinus TaxID=7757 RepID=UPI003F6EBD54
MSRVGIAPPPPPAAAADARRSARASFLSDRIANRFPPALHAITMSTTAAASAARHAAKRLGVNGEGNDRVQAGAMDTFEDPHKPPPSGVVHVRGLLDTALESDLVEAVRHFGLVSYAVMMPKTRQALVEFEDPESSRSCVDYSSTGSVYVCGQPAYFNFSTSQKLWRPGVPGDNGNSNHVLLFTILNPIYPITTDVLYNICKPFGPLQRIVIFRKNGLQAFVEFVSVESAERANSSLNGADIYSGCCTLIVDYARATRLNVFKNDSETWDFTNPGLKQRPTRAPHACSATSRNTRRSTPHPLHRNRQVPLGRGHRITRVQPQAPGGHGADRPAKYRHRREEADSEKAAKNRNQRPTAVLHFFNAPTDITVEMFAQLCDEMSIARPRSFKVFSGKTDRSVSGLMEWETKNDAMEALACINHHPLKNANVPYLYTLKLCFSTAQPS